MSQSETAASPQQAIIRGPTRLYAIVGDPIAQVKSPGVFNPRLLAAGKDAVLIPMHVPADRFEETMRSLMAIGNLDGIVITVPFKARAMALVDEVTPMAQTIGAINALRRDGQGRWIGDHFDGRGLIGGLLERGVALAGARVMLLGAGGAGSAVAMALAEAGVSVLTISDVQSDRAEALARRVNTHFPRCTAVAGAVAIADHALLINATPVGMTPSTGLPTPVDALTRDVIVVDIVMEPAITPLLAAAQARGCPTFGGRVMIEGQAAAMMRFFGIES